MDLEVMMINSAEVYNESLASSMSSVRFGVQGRKKTNNTGQSKSTAQVAGAVQTNREIKVCCDVMGHTDILGAYCCAIASSDAFLPANATRNGKLDFSVVLRE